MTILTTKRLILRNFRADDIDELYDYRNSEVCYRYQRNQARNKDDLIAFIHQSKEDDLRSDGKKHLAISLGPNDEIIGDIFISLENPTISLGYTLSYKHHRLGYAFEIVSSIVGFLHERYPAREFVCCTERDNLASIGLLTKLGFQNEGYRDEIDSYIFSKYSK